MNSSKLNTLLQLLLGFAIVANAFRIINTLLVGFLLFDASVIFAIILSALQITSLGLILSKKRAGVFLFFGTQLLTVALNTAFDGDFLTHLFVAVVFSAIMFALLQLKSNGISAWKLIMHNNTQKNDDDNGNSNLPHDTLPQPTPTVTSDKNNAESDEKTDNATSKQKKFKAYELTDAPKSKRPRWLTIVALAAIFTIGIVPMIIILNNQESEPTYSKLDDLADAAINDNLLADSAVDMVDDMAELNNWDIIYDDLNAKGYFKETREQFMKRMSAPGELGYLNRRAFYEDLKREGYFKSPNYETWVKGMGIHAVKQAATTPPSAATPDKIDQLYDALKADGAVSKSRENFRSYMLASGKQGYRNRKQLYDALKADGAVESATYEEFADRLGLHAVKQAATTPPSAATPDNFDILYDDLSEQGYLKNGREFFRSKMLAPGAEGYKNRKALYDDLKSQGYLQSPTYEEWMRRMGLHAVKQAKKPLKTLYNSLKADNYDVPDNYESFERTLTAPGAVGTNNRIKLYGSLKADNYDVPDTYESFAKTLFAPVKPSAKTLVQNNFFGCQLGKTSFKEFKDEINNRGFALTDDSNGSISKIEGPLYLGNIRFDRAVYFFSDNRLYKVRFITEEIELESDALNQFENIADSLREKYSLLQSTEDDDWDYQVYTYSDVDNGIHLSLGYTEVTTTNSKTGKIISNHKKDFRIILTYYSNRLGEQASNEL